MALRAAARRCGLLTAAVLLGSARWAQAAPEPEPASAPGPAAVRSALPVFVSYPANLVAYPQATELRRAASRALATALAAAGRDVVTYPDLEPLMRQWNVRSERDVEPEFLQALTTELGAQEVVIATFSIYRDRLLLAARGLSPSTGRLTWVASVEEARTAPEPALDTRHRGDTAGDTAGDTDAGTEADAGMDTEAGAATATDPTSELASLAASASARLARISGAPRTGGGGTGETVVVMPLHPVGVDRGPAALALHCLLRSLLATGRWSIPDPTAVVSALQHEGHDPLLLDAESRHLLADRFGAATLLIPRLVAFPPRGAGPAALVEDPYADDAPGPDRAGGSDVPVQLTLVRVDCASGRILAGEGDYLAAPSPYGIFGTFDRIPLDRRFQVETDRLVDALLARNEGDGK